jgi:hypothetical protein
MEAVEGMLHRAADRAPRVVDQDIDVAVLRQHGLARTGRSRPCRRCRRHRHRRSPRRFEVLDVANGFVELSGGCVPPAPRWPRRRPASARSRSPMPELAPVTTTTLLRTTWRRRLDLPARTIAWAAVPALAHRALPDQAGDLFRRPGGLGDRRRHPLGRRSSPFRRWAFGACRCRLGCRLHRRRGAGLAARGRSRRFFVVTMAFPAVETEDGS